MNKEELVQVSLTITNNCWYCLQIDSKCPECQDQADTNLTILAHKVVDEGNLQYKRPWLIDSEQVSGHDWIGSLVRTPKGERNEFLEPVCWLEDRIDDRDLELGLHEKVCNHCYLAFNAYLPECPACEMADK